MSTILDNCGESSTRKRLISKGGADIMVDLCTHFINEEGEKEQITP
jgi:hypothetical protein